MRSTERITLAPAFLLHQRAWRESSKIVEIFSYQFGRVGLVARGSRRNSSPWRAALIPFRPLLISWNLHGELGTLTNVEPAGPMFKLVGRQLLAAYYLNELILYLLARQDPQPELFDQYSEALEAFVDSKRMEVALRIFELRLLSAIGYGLNLERDQLDAQVMKDAYYRFDGERGLSRISNSDTAGVVVKGATLQALASGSIDTPEMRREARLLLRSALDTQLGGRKLKSREILREWSRYSALQIDRE